MNISCCNPSDFLLSFMMNDKHARKVLTSKKESPYFARKRTYKIYAGLKLYVEHVDNVETDSAEKIDVNRLLQVMLLGDSLMFDGMKQEIMLLLGLLDE